MKLLSIFVCLIWIIESRKLPDIYWNSTNPIFDISNTDHVKQVRLLDRITIICPRPHKDQEEEYEYSKLFVVSREEYDTCELFSNHLLGTCATPERQSSISIVFRDFSPLPSAFEFHPGHSYYVITTSNGTQTGLNNTFGGLCLMRNMKLKFEVLKTEEATESTSSRSGSPNENDVAPAQQKSASNPNKNEFPPSYEPITYTYVINTVEPEQHYKMAHSLLGENSVAASYLERSLYVGSFLILFLLDFGWRRILI